MAGRQTKAALYTPEELAQVTDLDDYERRQLLAQSAAEGRVLPDVLVVPSDDPDVFGRLGDLRPRRTQAEIDAGKFAANRRQAEEMRKHFATCEREEYYNTDKSLESVEINGYIFDIPYKQRVDLPLEVHAIIREREVKEERYEALSRLYAERLNRPIWAMRDAHSLPLDAE
jgi:hypothetical protein